MEMEDAVMTKFRTADELRRMKAMTIARRDMGFIKPRAARRLLVGYEERIREAEERERARQVRTEGRRNA